MILSGKDLFNYRVNQIKKVALMLTSIVAMVSALMAMCVVCG